MDLVSVECPSCGASLPPAEPTGGYECEYCGERFELGRARGAKTMAGQQISVKELAQALAEAQRRMAQERAAAEARERAERMAQTKSSGVRAAVVISLVAAALGILVTVSVGVMATGQVRDAASVVSGALERAGAAMGRELWDDVGGPPEPVAIGGKPAVIGRTRNVTAGDKLFIDAYDLSSGERLWRIDGLGTYGTAYQHVRFGVVGESLIVTDAEAKLHIHDLQSGARKQTVALTDKVEYVCTPGQARRAAGLLALPPSKNEGGKRGGQELVDPFSAARQTAPEGEGRAWIEQIDDRSFLLDLATGKLTEAKRPKWCARSVHDAKTLLSGAAPDAIEARYARKVHAPKVKGVRVERSFVVGERAVALAIKAPGTPVPRAFGYAPGAKQADWVVDVADVQPASVRNADPLGALDERRFVAVYGVGQDEWRMTALDATSGERLWSRALRPVFAVDKVESVTLTDAHVLLVHSTALEVFDATTGEPVRVIGSIRYE